MSMQQAAGLLGGGQRTEAQFFSGNTRCLFREFFDFLIAARLTFQYLIGNGKNSSFNSSSQRIPSDSGCDSATTFTKAQLAFS